ETIISGLRLGCGRDSKVKRKQKAESKTQKADGTKQKATRICRALFFCLLPTAYCLLFFSLAHAQVGDYEGRPVATVDVVLEGTPADPTAQGEFKGMLKVVPGGEYSAANVRQSLHDLYASGRVASARIEIDETAGGARSTPVRVRFVVQRQIVIAGVTIKPITTTGATP